CLSFEWAAKSRALEGVPGLETRLLGPGLVGPSVPRVAALHLLLHVGPRTAPEAGQVARRLERAAGRAGELEQQRRVADHRVTLEAEQRLHADFDARGVVAGVVDRVAGAGGGDELAR